MAGRSHRIWPWLVQVGWHRGVWYTPRWVDVLLFPDNQPSAVEVLQDYQKLSIGDLCRMARRRPMSRGMMRGLAPPRHATTGAAAISAAGTEPDG